MIPVRFPGRLVAAGALVVGLSACGIRGPLEPPPQPGAPGRQSQDQTRGPGRSSSGAVAGQTAIPPLAQTSRVEGQPPVPDEDDADEAPSIIRQPLPGAQPAPTTPGGRRRGYTVPKDPFVLDPLL